MFHGSLFGFVMEMHVKVERLDNRVTFTDMSRSDEAVHPHDVSIEIIVTTGNQKNNRPNNRH